MPPTVEQLAQNILGTIGFGGKGGGSSSLSAAERTPPSPILKSMLPADTSVHRRYGKPYQKYAGIRDPGLPGGPQSSELLIGVDEEGGNVVRVSKYPEFRAEPFRSPQSLFAEGGFPLNRIGYKGKGRAA
jgi:hypothetical protein